MGVFELKLTENSEQLSGALNNIIEASATSARTISSQLEKDIEKLTKKGEAAERKLSARQHIYDNQNARSKKKYADFLRSDERTRTAKCKFLNRQDSFSNIDRQLREMRSQLTQKQNFLGEFKELYDEGSFANRAFMLRSSEEFIDKTKPIVYTTDTVRKVSEVLWFTEDIKIKNGFGGYLPTSFGKFRVNVRYEYSRVNQVIVNIYGVGDNIYTGDYAHPHIRRNGEPCLGNVQRMLLEHMSKQDIANVVYMVTEYLISYNHIDPFSKLSTFGVHNKWDHKKCNCGNSLFIDGCDVCDHAEEAKRDCGLTPSECMRYHRNSHPSEDKGSCVLEEVVNFISPAQRLVANLKALGEGVPNESNQEANG